jgi:hypothetical protein
MKFHLWVAGLLVAFTSLAGVTDTPFKQDAAVRIQLASPLDKARFSKLIINADGVVYALADEGVARVYDRQLALDRSFRPLSGKRALDLALGPAGVYYLYKEAWLSNDDTGKPRGVLPTQDYQQIAVNQAGAVLVGGAAGCWLFESQTSQSVVVPEDVKGSAYKLYAEGMDFYLLAPKAIYRWRARWEPVLQGTNLACLAFRGSEMLVGDSAGYYGVDRASGQPATPRQSRLPCVDIRCLRPVEDGLWVGTSRGLFFQRTQPPAGPALPDGPNGIRYYASKRWLVDDQVVDLALDPDGQLWALTKTGLNKIEFRAMTLADKAEYFDRKVRSRHLRYGFSAERRLAVAGDLASGEMIDTDNDGGWSSYYLASQAFRYAATGQEKARRNAWETFAALERLQSINPLEGFPARTFERRGFRYSDPERWADSPEDGWEWKHTTSSDEIASHTFAYAVLYECAVKTEAEKTRVARCFTRIVDHIIRNQYYLVDLDGRPTLWGRWSPEYLNRMPTSIFDRRLNSSEIVASLQLAYHMTGKAEYRDKALELLDKHGYLQNITNSMKLLHATKGFIHQGIELGDEWNHSDDELAFITYWVLYRFALNEDLKRQYAAAIQDHWEFEQAEQYPFWNFIFAGCGGAEPDAAGAAWTLRGFPLDTVAWRVENSPRQDITRLAVDFYGRELKELLPPGEREIARCNTQPFILDGGDGGHTEFAGDEFLIGYWMGRYLKQIE